ncbi:hypothetical protein EJ05DRAFT_153461 [Pseudovirgaria hyperparasitica]|uniref:Cytochrome c oxidase assembly factor 3 n=1 Tax=Pseudovirgaria hyperparasitica TaxID=470096 RepID=A0A6A6VZK4_9PEZI|nr:uncharacterized protein EJ05DRAFT_153461 [Pseudovirgaria hyperparasitica]KAF2754241.1 hypothetical protein EJ05DRAFT_153461 [Pseudovirgaria hyperparasitica]
MRPSLPLRVLPKSSYYDKHYRQSPAMIRARQTYLVRNIVSGVGLGIFVIAVYAFTIKAVSQDEFSDVVVPEKPRSAAAAPHSEPPKSMGTQTVAK